VIFIACDEYKSKPIAAYRTNIKCGNFSSTSSGKRRTDEESSRQVRQKSSEVHMPQSSQDGMTRLDNHKVCSFFFQLNNLLLDRSIKAPFGCGRI